MAECVVINVGNVEGWDPHFCGAQMDLKTRPKVMHQSRESAEAEAVRLACQHGGLFAVLEVVGVVRGKVLADTDRVRGLGPCGALYPQWQDPPSVLI